MQGAVTARAFAVGAALLLATASAAAAPTTAPPPATGPTAPSTAQIWVSLAPIASSAVPAPPLAQAQQFLEQLARTDARLMIGAPGSTPPASMPAYLVETTVLAFDPGQVVIQMRLLSYSPRVVIADTRGTCALSAPPPSGIDPMQTGIRQAWLGIAPRIVP